MRGFACALSIMNGLARRQIERLITGEIAAAMFAHDRGGLNFLSTEWASDGQSGAGLSGHRRRRRYDFGR